MPADDDAIAAAVGYAITGQYRDHGEFWIADTTVDGARIELWWERDPGRMLRTLYARSRDVGTPAVNNAVAVAVVSEMYVAADPRHQYRVSRGAIRRALASPDQFVPEADVHTSADDSYVDLALVEGQFHLWHRRDNDTVLLRAEREIVGAVADRGDWRILADLSVGGLRQNGVEIMYVPASGGQSTVRVSASAVDAAIETLRRSWDEELANARRSRSVYMYGPAWGSVTVSEDAQVAAPRMRYDKARRTIVTTPEPEPTVRPTGGRRFVLDDDD